jgi:predicted nuclease of predicted toxin-antitoxin system
MRLPADLHIAPRTVELLRTLGHDVCRVTDLLPANASDEAIIEQAAQERRTILTQDLDFSSIIALSGRPAVTIEPCARSDSRIGSMRWSTELTSSTFEEFRRRERSDGALVDQRAQ